MTSLTTKVSILAVLTLILVGYMLRSSNTSNIPVYTYMTELNGTNYPVDYCNLESSVLTYTQDGFTIQQMCEDCKCQKDKKD